VQCEMKLHSFKITVRTKNSKWLGSGKFVYRAVCLTCRKRKSCPVRVTKAYGGVKMPLLSFLMSARGRVENSVPALSKYTERSLNQWRRGLIEKPLVS